MNKQMTGKIVRTVLLVLVSFAAAVLIWLFAKYGEDLPAAYAAIPKRLYRG